MLLLSRTSCAVGNGRFCNIHRTHPMSSCNYDLFAKVKEPLRGTQYKTRDELIRTTGLSIGNINKEGRTDNILRVRNIWRRVISKGGDYIEDKLHKCCTPVDKAMPEISKCCRYFLSNPCIFFLFLSCQVLMQLIFKIYNKYILFTCAKDLNILITPILLVLASFLYLISRGIL